MKKVLVGFMFLLLFVIVLEGQNTMVNAAQSENQMVEVEQTELSNNNVVPNLLTHQRGGTCPSGQVKLLQIGPFILCGEIDPGGAALWGGCGGWTQEFNTLNAYTC